MVQSRESLQSVRWRLRGEACSCKHLSAVDFAHTGVKCVCVTWSHSYRLSRYCVDGAPLQGGEWTTRPGKSVSPLFMRRTELASRWLQRAHTKTILVSRYGNKTTKMPSQSTPNPEPYCCAPPCPPLASIRISHRMTTCKRWLTARASAKS